MRTHASITSLPQSPDQERSARMVKYAVTMGIRLVCVLLCFVVPGWWMLIPAVGAVVLPYIAVIVANEKVVTPAARVERPGAIERRRGPHL